MKQQSSLLAVFFTCFLISACAVPDIAQARYNDMADGYPAIQDVTIGGDPIDASMIPDGTYAIGNAASSSSMCKLSNCTLHVSNGSMHVTCTSTGAYTAIYLGSADEAVAASGEAGTDTSAYIMGDPPSGYVPHSYSLPISALNSVMVIATYNGGTHGDEGAWYTRAVSFNSTREIDALIGRSNTAGDEAAQASRAQTNVPETAVEVSTAESMTDASDTSAAGSNADDTSISTGAESSRGTLLSDTADDTNNSTSTRKGTPIVFAETSFANADQPAQDTVKHHEEQDLASFIVTLLCIATAICAILTVFFVRKANRTYNAKGADNPAGNSIKPQERN